MHSTYCLAVIRSFAIVLLSVFLIAACSSGDSSNSGTVPSAVFRVDCSSSATYAPAAPPVETPSSSGPASTTIIVMHGKTGSPLSTHLLPLYSALSSAGYDVVAPYMPWNGLDWDGSMCEGMNYIDSLAAKQASNGRNVIVAGHSMGGAHALIHGATEPAGEIKAIVTLAPGHFPHLSNNSLNPSSPGTQVRTAPQISQCTSSEPPRTVVLSMSYKFLFWFSTLIDSTILLFHIFDHLARLHL